MIADVNRGGTFSTDIQEEPFIVRMEKRWVDWALRFPVPPPERGFAPRSTCPETCGHCFSAQPPGELAP
eukprot:7859953-Pyramimonas_sp.AAC.1